MDNTQQQQLASSIEALNNTGQLVLQGKISRKNLKLQQDMVNRQRDDAITSARFERQWAKNDWQKTADYNSPEQQMARLKAAGLNPHLVYGNGADAQVGDIRGSNISTPNYDTPQQAQLEYSASNPLMQYYDLQSKQQGNDNTALLAEVYKAQADKIRTEALVESQNLLDKKLAYDIQTEIRDSAVAYSGLRNDKIKSDIDTQSFYKNLAASRFNFDKFKFSLEEKKFELQRAKTQSEMDKILSEIIQNNIQNANLNASRSEIQARTKQITEATKLTEIHVKLKKLGLQPGNPEYYRRYVELVNEALSHPVSILKSVLK